MTTCFNYYSQTFKVIKNLTANKLCENLLNVWNMQNIYLENENIYTYIIWRFSYFHFYWPITCICVCIYSYVYVCVHVCGTYTLVKYTDGFIIPWYHYFPIRKRAYSDCYVFFDNGSRNLIVPITNWVYLCNLQNQIVKYFCAHQYNT